MARPAARSRQSAGPPGDWRGTAQNNEGHPESTRQTRGTSGEYVPLALPRGRRLPPRGRTNRFCADRACATIRPGVILVHEWAKRLGWVGLNRLPDRQKRAVLYFHAFKGRPHLDSPRTFTQQLTW